MSSGAAVAGSPLSGGYAGAKSTIRFITGYAADESARAGLGIRFVSVLPKLTPATELGSAAVEAYARRNDLTVEQYLEEIGPGITPEDVGKATLELTNAAGPAAGAFLLTPAGLSPLP
jgi:NAD(P)-dependent dehydrogenase (short-subunit alcohol dehydrogenase family)